MKRNKPSLLWIAPVVALLAVGVAAAEEENTWVTKEGHALRLPHGHHAMFIAEEDGENFDLADLADGESRVFGQGDKQVTATRSGGVVVIKREARGEEKALEISCSVDQDSCQVVTFPDEPEKVMIVVKKTRECVNGVGDCADVDVTLEGLGDVAGATHAVVRKVKCDDQGNCETFEDVHHSGDSVEVIADFDGSGDPHGNIVIMRSKGMHPGQVMLRCPEGDATVHVAREEANDTFLCPKHNVPMQQAEMPRMIRKIRVEGDE